LEKHIDNVTFKKPHKIAAFSYSSERVMILAPIKQSLKKLFEYYDQVISLPHKPEIAREIRDEDDLFLLLIYSDLLGIPNPAFYYTLELYPYIIEKFHEWHLRMGMEKSLLSGIRCC
jgi:hypothetical protein